jgi:hypothetical protein
MSVIESRFRRVLMGAIMCWAVSVPPAHAESPHQRVQMSAEGASHEIMVHPVYITELTFPDKVTNVAVSDDEDFLVHAMERKVLLRPKQSTEPGTLSNLLIESRTWRVMILVRVAVRPDDAVVSVTFEPPDSTSDTGIPAEPQQARITAGKGAAAAKDAENDTAELDRIEAAEPSPEPAENAAMVRDEPRISVQVNGTIGRAVIGDRMTTQTGGLLLAGIAARVAYPRSPYYAYDGTLTVAGSGVARFPDVMLGHDVGEMWRSMVLSRFELGVSARLPARLTPVVRVGLGVQGRALVSSRLVLANGAAIEGPDDELIIDVTGSATLGMEYGITRTWRAGVSVTAIHAEPFDNGPRFDAWEGSIHVSWN